MPFSDSPAFDDVLRIVISAGEIASESPAISLSQLVRQMYNSGMSKENIRERLLTDLREGGPIFGEFKNQFKSSYTQAVENTASLTRGTIYQESLPDEQLYKWVLTKENNCEDCIERAGREPMTWSEWESEGLPQSGVTLCGLNCGCFLDPEGASEKVEEREPIVAQEDIKESISETKEQIDKLSDEQKYDRWASTREEIGKDAFFDKSGIFTELSKNVQDKIRLLADLNKSSGYDGIYTTATIFKKENDAIDMLRFWESNNMGARKYYSQQIKQFVVVNKKQEVAAKLYGHDLNLWK